MERIGIYGGTFDPPHVGHIRAARFAVQALGLNTLLLIPSSISPNKKGKTPVSTDEQRLAMLKLAAGEDPTLQVSQIELRRGGISYTHETLKTLRAQYPDAELVLCMGADMFAAFESWREYEAILKTAALAVFSRGPSQTEPALQEQKEKLEALGAKVYLLENPVTDISSTQLKRMLRFGCADPFLDPQVAAFIREKGLYGTADDLIQLPMGQLEKVVISLLKPDRVAHVLGCRDTAVELARRWGADETDAARAGVLHDITKALDGPLQLTLCREYGIVLDKFSTQNPKTLHALTGALVAERIFGENQAVTEAIRWHTTGKANMNTLQKIIYVADYMEPNRDFPGVEQLRRLAYTDLDGALKLGLEMTLTMLRQQGREISPGSQEAIAWLNRKL